MLDDYGGRRIHHTLHSLELLLAIHGVWRQQFDAVLCIVELRQIGKVLKMRKTEERWQLDLTLAPPWRGREQRWDEESSKKPAWKESDAPKSGAGFWQASAAPQAAPQSPRTNTSKSVWLRPPSEWMQKMRAVGSGNNRLMQSLEEAGRPANSGAGLCRGIRCQPRRFGFQVGAGRSKFSQALERRVYGA